LLAAGSLVGRRIACRMRSRHPAGTARAANARENPPMASIMTIIAVIITAPPMSCAIGSPFRFRIVAHVESVDLFSSENDM